MGFNSSLRGLCRSIGNRQVLNVGCHYTHTFLLDPSLFIARDTPLKSNPSPSCYKLTPVLEMERVSPSKEGLQNTAP